MLNMSSTEENRYVTYSSDEHNKVTKHVNTEYGDHVKVKENHLVKYLPHS